jgi:glucose/arabinose dehydrogenase
MTKAPESFDNPPPLQGNTFGKRLPPSLAIISLSKIGLQKFTALCAPEKVLPFVPSVIPRSLFHTIIQIVALSLLCLSACAAELNDSYKITPIPTPENTPLEVGGMDWMPDGRLIVCTRRGEVWTLSGSQRKLFASGLQEALGLIHGDKGNDVYVMQRPELTHLVDTDGDGIADRYETVTADFGFSGNYHEFAYGPAKDKDGYLYFSLNLAHAPDAFGGPYMGAHKETPYRGWVFRSEKPNSAGGKFVPWAYGLRSPNGLAASPDGEIFFADNQGEWIGSNWLGQVKHGRFYGNPSSMIFTKDWNDRDPKSVPLEELEKKKTPPAIIFPYGRMGQSLSQPAWDTTAGKFGPFQGQIFVGDVQYPLVMRATLEKVDGEYQGACYPFLRHPDLQGANRLLFAPDGSLLVGRTDRGWVRGSAGLARVTYTGQVPFEILSMSLTKTGFDVTFTKPVARERAADPKTYALLHWHLIYHKTYGSPEADKTAVKIDAVKISDEGRKVSLTLGELLPGKVYDLTINELKSAEGSELKNKNAYYTLNRPLP